MDIDMQNGREAKMQWRRSLLLIEIERKCREMLRDVEREKGFLREERSAGRRRISILCIWDSGTRM
jgi:hypothetical protein